MPDKSVQDRGSEGIAALAEAQHGVVSAAQLYALRLSRDQVSRLVRAGWLHRVHRGVYAVGHSRLTREGAWMAAVLAAGEGTVLSHRSAAALWGVARDQGRDRTGWAVAHVIRSGRGAAKARPGLVVHRSTTFVSGESTTHRGIRVTTPPRTILDLASVLEPRPLERAIDEAERLSLSHQRDLEAVAAAHRGEPGAGVLRRVLRSHTIGSTLTRSELEERFLRLCSDRRLPQPLVNAPLHDLTVDFLWADARVVAELDGRGSHDTRRAFQDDRDRDSLLAAHRYVTLRFTWWDVTQRPAVVADRLRGVLAHRRDEPSIADA